MDLYIADGFTTQRFSGNPAGVALLGDEAFPAEEWMRALAGELKHSETAFVRRTGEREFHIRYFTPAEEVELCGHATIASFTVLRETGEIKPGVYALHTLSGDLEIEVGEDSVWMDIWMAPFKERRKLRNYPSGMAWLAFTCSVQRGRGVLRPGVGISRRCTLFQRKRLLEPPTAR